MQPIAEVTQKEEKAESEQYPNECKNQRLFQGYFVAVFVENTQIERQKKRNHRQKPAKKKYFVHKKLPALNLKRKDTLILNYEL